MSVRSSIVYVGPIHIYRNVVTENICIDLVESENGDDDYYGDAILKLEDLKQVYRELGEYLGEK